jgi:hypothetical protein
MEWRPNGLYWRSLKNKQRRSLAYRQVHRVRLRLQLLALRKLAALASALVQNH